MLTAGQNLFDEPCGILDVVYLFEARDVTSLVTAASYLQTLNHGSTRYN